MKVGRGTQTACGFSFLISVVKSFLTTANELPWVLERSVRDTCISLHQRGSQPGVVQAGVITSYTWIRNGSDFEKCISVPFLSDLRPGPLVHRYVGIFPDETHETGCTAV